jgi:hypothetical protein
VLLRGCKRFRLYPPEAAPDMYVRGKLKRIYPNGRIVYEGQGDVLPDGSGTHMVECIVSKTAHSLLPLKHALTGP